MRAGPRPTTFVGCPTSGSTPRTRRRRTSRRRSRRSPRASTRTSAIQTLLGVTGSGKTFTMAQRHRADPAPALVISHNKTLAAQLYGEFREFFPQQRRRVLRQLLRLLPARSLHPRAGHLHREGRLDQRRDRPAAARRHRGAPRPPRRRDRRRLRLVHLRPRLAGGLRAHDALFEVGDEIDRDEIFCQARRTSSTTATTSCFERGKFRVRGDVVEIWPAYEESAFRIEAVRRRGRVDPATSTRSPARSSTQIEHVASTRPSTSSRKERDRAGGRGDQGGARGAGRLVRGARASCSRRSGCSSAPVRHRDAAGGRVPLGHRELLAASSTGASPASRRTRCSTSSRPTSSASSTSRTRRPADPRDVRGRPLAQEDAGRARLPAAVARSTTARCGSTSGRPDQPARHGLRHAGRLRALASRRGSSSRSSARPAWSTPRSRCASRGPGGRPDERGQAPGRRRASGCWSRR